MPCMSGSCNFDPVVIDRTDDGYGYAARTSVIEDGDVYDVLVVIAIPNGGTDFPREVVLEGKTFVNYYQSSTSRKAWYRRLI